MLTVAQSGLYLKKDVILEVLNFRCSITGNLSLSGIAVVFVSEFLTVLSVQLQQDTSLFCLYVGLSKSPACADFLYFVFLFFSAQQVVILLRDLCSLSFCCCLLLTTASTRSSQCSFVSTLYQILCVRGIENNCVLATCETLYFLLYATFTRRFILTTA